MSVDISRYSSWGGWKFFSFVKGWGSFFVSHSEGLGGLFCFVPIFFVFCSTTGSFSPTGRIVCVSIKSNILDIIIFLSKTNVFVFVIRNSDSVSLFTGGGKQIMRFCWLPRTFLIGARGLVFFVRVGNYMYNCDRLYIHNLR